MLVSEAGFSGAVAGSEGVRSGDIRQALNRIALHKIKKNRIVPGRFTFRTFRSIHSSRSRVTFPIRPRNVRAELASYHERTSTGATRISGSLRLIVCDRL